MIFVTVGTELPFDRIVRPIDDWAKNRKKGTVFAQVGPSNYRPRNIEWVKFLETVDCRAKIAAADVVIAHAGMGTILTALEMGKPILVVPRRAELGEVRSNHQVATAEKLLAQGKVSVAMDEHQLLTRLDQLHSLPSPERIQQHAPRELLRRLSQFIELGVKDAGSDFGPEVMDESGDVVGAGQGARR
jgi:UDP-N-acetylglucosamine transferase subunit ALG13